VLSWQAQLSRFWCWQRTNSVAEALGCYNANAGIQVYLHVAAVTKHNENTMEINGMLQKKTNKSLWL
jgi:hypothetical protein